MSLSTQPYKGARDFYPEDMRLRNKIFETWRKVCISYGYEEYDTPILEPLELYTSKTSSEIVTEQSYLFEDRGGRQIMLRPEMTPSVSRLIAGRRQELPLPIRWFSIPNCWRYERPQKGRGREFYQLNVDMFGVDMLEAEVEMIQLVNTIMKEFGAKPDMYTIKLNDRKFMNYILGEWIGLDEVEQVTVSRLIDRMHKIPEVEFRALIEAAITPSLRDSGAAHKLVELLKIKSVKDLPEDLRKQVAYMDLFGVLLICEELGLDNVEFDISLMRGFDYYSGVVFEVFDADPDNNRSMFGGGRYDSLVGMFGVEPIPTVGFGMGDITIMEFLKSHGLLPELSTNTEVWLIPIAAEKNAIRKLSAELRDMGVNVAVDLSGKKPGQQIKNALRNGVPYVMFVGEQEIQSEQYKLKNLSTGVEEPHSIQRVVSIIKDYRK